MSVFNYVGVYDVHSGQEYTKNELSKSGPILKVTDLINSIRCIELKYNQGTTPGLD